MANLVLVIMIVGLIVGCAYCCVTLDFLSENVRELYRELKQMARDVEKLRSAYLDDLSERLAKSLHQPDDATKEGK